MQRVGSGSGRCDARGMPGTESNDSCGCVGPLESYRRDPCMDMSDARSLWNPYAQLTPQTRRALGIGSVLTVLAVWALVSGTGLVSEARLPAPWSVASALGYLTWDGERHRS